MAAFHLNGFEATSLQGSTRPAHRFNGLFVATGERVNGRPVYMQCQNSSRYLAWRNGHWRYYSLYDSSGAVGQKDECTFHVRSDGATLAEIAPGAEWNVGESAAKHREGVSSFRVQIEEVSKNVQVQEWISKSFGKGMSGKDDKGKGKGTGKGKPEGKGKDEGKGKGKGFPKGKGAECNMGESAVKHREGAYSFREQIEAVSMDIQVQEVDFLLVGSSVAAAAKGWSGLLRKALQTRGKSLANACTPGNNTARTMPDLQHALMRFKPKVVIIALSTGNEGLARQHTSSSAAAVAEQFKLGVQALADVAEAAGAKVVLGSVYPNDEYDRHHYSLLKQVFTQQCSSGYLVLDFLTCTDDGNGNWRDGLWQDAGHPNRAGHAAMFGAIDLEKLIAVAE